MKEVKGRTEIINYLIKKYNLKSYLEIGSAWKGNFDLIICQHKISVDPAYDCDYKMTSNDFFKINKEKFDIVFIDGLHHVEQAMDDFNNSHNSLNKNGFIVMHDCLPTREEHQLREKHPIVGQSAWTGDVWKCIVSLRKEGFLNIDTINYDWGCSVYHKSCDYKIIGKTNNVQKLEYQDFEQNKYKMLNIITLEEFYKRY